MVANDEDIARDEEGDETEEYYAARIRNLDNEIQAAFLQFNQQEQTEEVKNEYFRKRNALYSQRNVCRVKHSIASLAKKKRELDDVNKDLQTEHKRLKLLVAMATNQVQMIESTSSQPSDAAPVPPASMQTSLPRANQIPPTSRQRQRRVPASLPATSGVRDARTSFDISKANRHPFSVHQGGMSSMSDTQMSGTHTTSVIPGRLPRPHPDRVCSDATDYAGCESHVQHSNNTYIPVILVPQGLGHSMMVDSSRQLQTRLPVMRHGSLSRDVSLTTEVLDAPVMIGQPNRLRATPVLGRDCFLQPRDQSVMMFGQSDSYEHHQDGDEILPHGSSLVLPPKQNLPYPLPRKSSLGGLAYLKKVCLPNPTIRGQAVPMRSNADILQRLDNVRRLQETVFQELQDLMAVPE